MLARAAASPTLLIAAGAWLLLDLVRAWSPTLITVFGQAAATPPERIGAFALGCLLVPVAVLALVRARPTAARVLGWVALALAVLARVLLQASSGGYPHLVVATAGVIAAMVWLALTLARFAGVAVSGLVAGIAASVLTHAALGTWGAVWRTDRWGWALLVVQMVLLMTGAARSRGRLDDRPLPRRFAWLVWPGLFLVGVVVGNAGRASAVADWLGLALVAAGAVAAVAATRVRVSRGSAIAAGALLVAVVACALLVTVDGQSPAWVALGYLVGMPALAHVWAAADAGPSGSPVTVALGGVLWVVLLFAYYAGYDLGYRADGLVVAVAVAVPAVGAAGPIRSRRGARLGIGGGATVAGLAVGAAAIAAVGPLVTIRPLDIPDQGADVTTVAAYNLRMGYGMDGRFRPEEVAELLSFSDVALISEVDRGWYLNGGQDELAILERLLGRTAWFGAAADPVWGDAVLVDAPRVSIAWHPLPSHGAVTGAQALVVQPEGSPITFVATHLQPNADGVAAQAADLAAILAPLTAEGTVVVGGDLNLPEGSAGYEAIVAAGLVDTAPGGAFTSPADDPTQRIDYVFTTPDLEVSWVEVPQTTASDHLPVLVGLTAD